MSLFLELLQESKVKRKSGVAYSGLDNTIIYGVGKSALAAGLSKYLGKDVIALSPAGTSSMLEDNYPNFHCVNINSFEEANAIINDILSETKIIDTIKRAIMFKDEKKLSDAKRRFKDKYPVYEKFAKQGDYPIGALVIEECATISGWIEYKIADEMGLDNLGEDKKLQSIDWNILKKRTWDFYSKVLRVPVPVILSTNTIEASEKRENTQRTPNLCTGSAKSMIIENVANVFYSYMDNNGEFNVQITEDNKTYCKNKLLPPESSVELKKTINTNKSPETLFKYLDNVRESVKKENQNKK